MITEELKILIYKVLALTGKPEYLLSLAWKYREQETTISCEKAVEIYRFLVGLNNASAMNSLGYMHLDEKYFPYNPKTAFFWFSRAAMLGNDTALSNVGVMYYEGTLGKINKKKAEECYKKAAGSSNIAAMFNLGVICLDNKNYECAYYWFLKATELGDYNSYLNLVYMKTHNLIDIPKTRLQELVDNIEQINEESKTLSRKI